MRLPQAGAMASGSNSGTPRMRVVGPPSRRALPARSSSRHAHPWRGTLRPGRAELDLAHRIEDRGNFSGANVVPAQPRSHCDRPWRHRDQLLHVLRGQPQTGSPGCILGKRPYGGLDLAGVRTPGLRIERGRRRTGSDLRLAPEEAGRHFVGVARAQDQGIFVRSARDLQRQRQSVLREAAQQGKRRGAGAVERRGEVRPLPEGQWIVRIEPA